MSNINISGNLYTKATGAGTDADPYVQSVVAGASDKAVSIIPVLDTAAYGAGDLLFDGTVIADAVRELGGTCVLYSIRVVDKADQGVPFTLYFTDILPDFGTVGSAPNPDDSKISTVIGWVDVASTDYKDLGDARIASIKNIGLGMQAAPNTTSLWVLAVNGSGTPTYALGDLLITFYFMRA